MILHFLLRRKRSGDLLATPLTSRNIALPVAFLSTRDYSLEPLEGIYTRILLIFAKLKVLILLTFRNFKRFYRERIGTTYPSLVMGHINTSRLLY